MPFRVVWDQPEPCPYLPDQTARLPLRLPLRAVGPDELDRALEEGDRRSGRMLYRTECPACRACEPLRVPVSRHRPTDSQRRVWRRNEGAVRVEVSAPRLTTRHLELYNRHKQERGLARNDEPLGPSGYRAWLVDTCVDTRELRYYVDDRMVAVSILDIGRTSASSVYHYFDPDESRRSLGVYSALWEIAWCAERGLEWYYLGFYVRDCARLAYKGGYWPHQRRVGGEWREFDGPEE